MPAARMCWPDLEFNGLIDSRRDKTHNWRDTTPLVSSRDLGFTQASSYSLMEGVLAGHSNEVNVNSEPTT